jgi:hypothetical protein
MSLGKWDAASVYWALWLGVGFLVPELYWLFKNPVNTLSYQVWRMGQVGSGHPWTFAHYFIAVFMLWLLGHFVLGLWR